MTVVNGQLANQTTFNNAFVSKTSITVANTVTGIIGLNNTTDPNSGNQVFNVQRYLNETADSDGTVGEGDATRKDYSSSNVVADGDSRKVAIGKIDAKFDSTTGHAHDGTPGNGAPVSASNLNDFNAFFAAWQTFTITGAVGVDDDVSTQLTGKTPGGSTITAGVVTSAPYNRCEIKDQSLDTYIEDAQGQRVYGRITEAAGVWTISYYTNEAGVETAYSFTSTNIRVYFREVFDQETRPTFSEEIGLVGSLDLTADIVDASATQRGVVSTGTQSFAGLKTFNDDIVFQESIATEREDVASAASISALSSDKSFTKLTGSTATTILGITAGVNGQKISVHNGTSTTVTFNNEDAGATAANRMSLPNSTPITLQALETQAFIYDTTLSRWVVDGGSGSGSGSGDGINFITNGEGNSTTGWATYSDAADDEPVDGTGGTATGVTFATNLTNPIFGLQDFKLSKDAADRQGKGVSYDFSIGTSDAFENRRSIVKFQYKGSANFVSGENSDVRVFLYDVTNSVLIRPVRTQLLSSTGEYLSSWNTTAGTSYRLIIHIATTNASAWDLQFDLVVVGPNRILTGPNIVDSFTDPGFALSAGFGTVTGQSIQRGQVGDAMVVDGYWQNGTVAASVARLDLPSGFVIDTTKYKNTAVNVVGTFKRIRTGAGTEVYGVLFFDGSDTDSIYFSSATTGTDVITKENGNDFSATSDGIYVTFKVFIKGYTADSAIAGSGVLRLSDILSNGTNVTATPTALGEYRTYIQNASASTGTDNAPSAAPSIANGMRIYSVPFASNGTSGQTNRWEIFIGYNKSWKFEPYANAGRTGWITTDNFYTATTDAYGIFVDYDEVTGCIIVDTIAQSSGVTSRNVGLAYPTGGASFTTATDCYFELYAADNDYQIQLSSENNIPVVIRDVKADTTAGGTFTSGAWQTRDLNSSNGSFSWFSLSSNQITLKAGTYIIRASAPAFRVDNHKAKLYDVTNTADVIIGTSEHSSSADTVVTRSHVNGKVVVYSNTVYELRHQAQSTKATDGYGLASSFGVDEVYSEVEITKIF